MSDLLDKIIVRFKTSDAQTRLELLLDYANRLSPLPDRYHAARDQGLNRVLECQSPVFLYMERQNGGLELHADAPREAPTVRGFVSLLQRSVRGASADGVRHIPGDLLDRLGLTEALGMTRMQGLTAIVARVKQMAADLAGAA